MSEDWLKIVKEKMESVETPAPDGVWEHLEAELFPAKADHNALLGIFHKAPVSFNQRLSARAERKPSPAGQQLLRQGKSLGKSGRQLPDSLQMQHLDSTFFGTNSMPEHIT